MDPPFPQPSDPTDSNNIVHDDNVVTESENRADAPANLAKTAKPPKPAKKKTKKVQKVRKRKKPETKKVEDAFIQQLYERNGFDQNPFGAKFTFNESEYQVIGFCENHTKFPVSVKRLSDGENILFKPDTVAEALGWDFNQNKKAKVVAPAYATDLETAQSLGFSDNIVGSTFNHDGVAYTVMGYVKKNRKYPVICSQPNSEKYIKVSKNFIDTVMQ